MPKATRNFYNDVTNLRVCTGTIDFVAMWPILSCNNNNATFNKAPCAVPKAADDKLQGAKTKVRIKAFHLASDDHFDYVSLNKMTVLFHNGS